MKQASSVAHSARVRAFCLSALCVLVLAACAGTKPKVEVAPPPPPKPPTEPLAWVPNDANVVARVSLDPFRKTPLWAMWTEMQRESQPFMAFIDLTLVDEVTLGGKLEGQQPETLESDDPPSVRRPSFVSVIRGRFGENYLANLAVKNQLVGQQKGLLMVYTRPQESWAQIAPDLLLVFSPDRAERVIARAGEGDGVGVRTTALYQTLAAKLSFETADLVLLAEDTSGVGRDELRKQGARVGIGPLADDVVRAGVSVKMGTDVLVAAVAETPDGPHAAALQQAVSDTLGALGRNLIVGIFGLRPVLAALKTSSEQNFVSVRGSIPQSDLEPALRKLATMLEMAAAASSESAQP